MTGASAPETRLNAKVHLNANIKMLWSAKYLAALMMALVLFYIFESFFGNWDAFMSEFLLHIAFLAIFAAFVSFYYVELKYKGYYYIITESEIIFRKGIFNTIKTVIPFKDIQNLSIEESIPERILGMASIRIDTAGPNAAGSEVIIPGVDAPEHLYDVLRKRMEASKGIKPEPAQADPVVFDPPEIHADARVDGLEKRISAIESKIAQISDKAEKTGKDTASIRESLSLLDAEMRHIHRSMADLVRSVGEHSAGMEKIGRSMAKITISKKAKGKRK